MANKWVDEVWWRDWLFWAGAALATVGALGLMNDDAPWWQYPLTWGYSFIVVLAVLGFFRVVVRTYREPTGSPLFTWLSTTNLRIRRCRSSSLGSTRGLGVVGTRYLEVLIDADVTSPEPGCQPASALANSSAARSCARKSP